MLQPPEWNWKVPYSRGGDLGVWRLRAGFVFELGKSAPQVLSALLESALPAWRSAAHELQARARRFWENPGACRSGDTAFAALGELPDAAEAVSGFRELPECRLANEAVDAVLARFNVLTPWMSRAAQETLAHALLVEDPEVVAREWAAPAFTYPGGDAPMPPAGALEWVLEDLPLAAYLERNPGAELYIAQVQVVALAAGFLPDPEFRKTGGRGLRQRLGWLVGHRVHGWSVDAIAAETAQEHQVHDELAPVTYSAVRDAVRKLEAQLGLSSSVRRRRPRNPQRRPLNR